MESIRIMITKRRPRKLFTLLLLYGMIGCLSFAGISNRATAESQIDPSVEFVEFWSDSESVFLFYPNLIKQVFLSIVDLKGNQRIAIKHINNEVLACTTGSNTFSACRLDQLKLIRRQKKMTRSIAVPANITRISGRPDKKDKNQYVLTIRWQPILFQPPIISVKDFYAYLGAAYDSKYYSLKKGLDQIQINPVFENKVSVVTSKARATNLLNLYRTPPVDFKDTFLFQVDAAHMRQIHHTANFDLHLKAVKVKINHLMFKTTKELLL